MKKNGEGQDSRLQSAGNIVRVLLLVGLHFLTRARVAAVELVIEHVLRVFFGFVGGFGIGDGAVRDVSTCFTFVDFINGRRGGFRRWSGEEMRGRGNGLPR